MTERYEESVGVIEHVKGGAPHVTDLVGSILEVFASVKAPFETAEMLAVDEITFSDQARILTLFAEADRPDRLIVSVETPLDGGCGTDFAALRLETLRLALNLVIRHHPYRKAAIRHDGEVHAFIPDRAAVHGNAGSTPMIVSEQPTSAACDGTFNDVRRKLSARLASYDPAPQPADTASEPPAWRTNLGRAGTALTLAALPNSPALAENAPALTSVLPQALRLFTGF